MALVAVSDRVISLGDTQVVIPERLLLAHARGEVLFIAGAGVSQPAGLPNFRGLVLEVYKKVDLTVYAVLVRLPVFPKNASKLNLALLTNQQAAEVKRFVSGDYDVVLGMLERRIDGQTHSASSVRLAIAQRLRNPAVGPVRIHQALMRLADRGGAVAIATTNFELLLEKAAKTLGFDVETYALGGIPRPGRREDFAGVFHIHGALDGDPSRVSDLVVSDQDFGEFYLRRRIVPDFIYDAARLFNLVLVGYSANDPPMRYLLNAVEADGKRFDDLKERFTFIGGSAPDPIAIEDWKARGITPIHYDEADDHSALLKTLEIWADLSSVNGRPEHLLREVKRIVRNQRSAASDADRDLFDHLFRRSNQNDRVSLAAYASKHKADLGWLDAIKDISAEQTRDRRK